jgi:hypothetical protein
MKSLTRNQHKFVCALLSGKTQEAAYAEAYPNSRKWTRVVRENTANRTLRLPHVLELYEAERERLDLEAREEAKRKNIWDKQRSVEALTFVIGAAVEDVKNAKKRQKEDNSDEPLVTSADSNAIIRAVSVLNKLLGFDKDTSKEIQPVSIIDDYKGHD